MARGNGRQDATAKEHTEWARTIAERMSDKDLIRYCEGFKGQREATAAGLSQTRWDRGPDEGTYTIFFRVEALREKLDAAAYREAKRRTLNIIGGLPAPNARKPARSEAATAFVEALHGLGIKRVKVNEDATTRPPPGWEDARTVTVTITPRKGEPFKLRGHCQWAGDSNAETSGTIQWDGGSPGPVRLYGAADPAQWFRRAVSSVSGSLEALAGLK
jgi:hypothetical protein